jgi:23S rRNA pseudouridine1911/1915/1917 synthase
MTQEHGEESVARSFPVLSEHRGLRLDRFLQLMLPRLSRARAQRIIDDGVALLSGRRPRPGRLVWPGEVVTVRRRLSTGAVEACRGPLPVLYEDDEIVAIDKPAPLACHPSARYLAGTVTDITGLRLAHRLDRETSGVLFLAKSERAERWLKAAFREKSARKRYVAWAAGEMPEERGRISSPLRLAPGAKARLRVEAHPAGLPAETAFRVLSRRGGASLVELFPETGRQHQLRVHLAALGHPILGDKLYHLGEEFFLKHCDGLLTEEERARCPWPRMLLHAAEVRLPRPGGGELLVEAPLPAELSEPLLPDAAGTTCAARA